MQLTLRFLVCAWCLVASRAVLAGGVISECSPEVFGPLSDDPLKTELNQPHGVSVDRQGKIYIADSSNGRVLKIEK